MSATTQSAGVQTISSSDNDKIYELIEAMKNPSVQYNSQERDLWGVMFYQTGTNEWSAIVASGYFAIAVHDIGFTPPCPFFSFRRNSFTATSPYPWSAQQLLDFIYRGFNQPNGIIYDSKLLLQIPNMINMIEQFSEVDQSKSRLILAPTPPREKAELSGIFQGDNFNKVFKSQRVPKPFVVREGMNLSEINPSLKYRFVVIGDHPDRYDVAITGTESAARMGMIVSPHGFIPEDMDAINQFKTIPPALTRHVFLGEGNPMFTPHHFDGRFFHTLLRSCLISGSPVAELSVTADYNNPVFMSTANDTKQTGRPRVDMMFVTLNWGKGPQRR